MNRLEVIAGMALDLARAELPEYSHPKSPKKFTQPQLLACLVLKAYQKSADRGTEDFWGCADRLRQALGLKQVPDHSTLQKFADRVVSPELLDRMFATLLQKLKLTSENAAMDSTGMEPTTRSAYYEMRSGGRRKQYVKLSLVILCGVLMPCVLVISRGPCNDKREARTLLTRAAERIRPRRLLADAGYDAEWIHEFCHDNWKVRSLIRLVCHRADGTAGGHWRSRMLRLPKVYGQRWHIETFMSGLKRLTGSQLASRKPNTLDTEAALRVVAYALYR